MISKVLAWVARKAWGGKVLELVDKLNGSLSGKRSEIILGVVALMYSLEKVGVIPDGAFDAAKPFLLGALPVTMAEKAKSALATANRVIPKKKK